MRAFRAVVGTLFFLGAVRLLFAFAGVIFFIAGMLDLFLFGNEASGLLAALTGVVVLASGYTGELWVRSPVAGPTSTPRAPKPMGPAIQEGEDSSTRQPRPSRGTEPTRS